jgi:hypothetical protein
MIRRLMPLLQQLDEAVDLPAAAPDDIDQFFL